MPLWLVKSPPWHMKLGMTRWKEEPLKPKPFSPVQSARKFSVWLDRGTGRFRRGRFAADRFFGFVGRFGGGAVVRGEAFFDGADTARKKCGRDEGGPKDGSADLVDGTHRRSWG